MTLTRITLPHAERTIPQNRAPPGFSCGNCWDNAVVESVFATLKTELIHHTDYQSPAEARAAIFEFIEVFYN